MKASRNAERVADTAKHRALRFVRFTKVVGLLLLLVFFVAACGKSEDAEVPLLDSGVFGFDSEPTYWIDDHRVMFVGWLGDKPRAREKGKRQTSENILIWDTELNEVFVHRESAWSLCYYDGFVRYLTGDPSLEAIPQRRLMTGRLGEEQTTQPKPITKENKQVRRQSKIDCRVWELSDAFAETYWKPLASAHGLLDLGPLQRDRKNPPEVTLKSLDGHLIRRLPMPWNYVSRVAYYEFRRAYLVQTSTHGFQPDHLESGCWPYWWIRPDGTSVQSCLRYGPWAGPGSMWLVGTAVGPVVISHNVEGARAVGDAGAYLVMDSTHVKLAAGLVWSPSVSQDGCKIAFLHSPGTMPKAAETDYWVGLKSVNLCSLVG